MSERAAPFHCPYCGDELLHPHVTDTGDAPAGAWECRSCLRAFALRFLGHIPRRESTS
ncbi:MAG: hypothetical protein V9F00_06355 [Nocardioides sp.]